RLLIEVGERGLPLAQDAERDRATAGTGRRAPVALHQRGQSLIEPRRERRVHTDDLVNERVSELVTDDSEVLVTRNVLQVDHDRALARQRDPAVRRCEKAGIRSADAKDLLQSEGEAIARRERVDRGTARERVTE